MFKDRSSISYRRNLGPYLGGDPSGFRLPCDKPPPPPPDTWDKPPPMPTALDQAVLDRRQGASPQEQLRLLANNPTNARAAALARYSRAVQEKGTR